MHDNLKDDPFGYSDLTIYPEPDSSWTKPTPEPSPASHPHLEGINDGKFFCVVSDGAVFGPYLTRNAAQSLVDENLADAEVIQMTLA